MFQGTFASLERTWTETVHARTDKIRCVEVEGVHTAGGGFFAGRKGGMWMEVCLEGGSCVCRRTAEAQRGAPSGWQAC